MWDLFLYALVPERGCDLTKNMIRASLKIVSKWIFQYYLILACSSSNFIAPLSLSLKLAPPLSLQLIESSLLEIFKRKANFDRYSEESVVLGEPLERRIEYIVDLVMDLHVVSSNLSEKNVTFYLSRTDLIHYLRSTHLAP